MKCYTLWQSNAHFAPKNPKERSNSKVEVEVEERNAVVVRSSKGL